MNRHKTAVTRRAACSALIALSFLICSSESFAQNDTRQRIAIGNLVAVAGENGGKTEIAESPATKIARFERQAFDIINQRRIEKDLPALVWSEEMAQVARAHSVEMAKYKFFSHAGRNGSMVDDRADEMGYRNWKAIGENIAYNRGYDNPAEFACERWMQSDSHRKNLLDVRWKAAAVGVAIAADGSHYFTEVFIALR